MSKIMIADDDVNIGRLIRLLLINEGFNVLVAADGIEALQRLNEEKIDLLITDIMMPTMDGWELCKKVREFSNMPVLILTVHGETKQKIKGFELGADDYLTKPFEPVELVARVKALLKRYNISISQVINIGDIVMDKNKFIIQSHAGEITLPLKEFELLFTLSSCPGKTYSREYLIETIWGYDFDGNERTLDVHIGRLRERFSQEQHGFKITTIRGLGYRLEELH